MRKGRESTTGQVYLVTFATERRQPHFREWDVAADAARLIKRSTAWQDSRLLAWALMPDHWHGMIELADAATLAGCVRKLKGGTARILRQQHPTLGWIWASGYHDHAIRGDEDLLETARYIVLNPVRAGLASRVGDYPFWDAVWLPG